jgi:hypothetical protein
MPFPGNTTYDPETLAVLGQAFDAAWHELQSAVLPVDAALAREELAARILFAADQGERDPERLKLHALAAFPLPTRSA